MATFTERLQILITADGAGAARELQQFGADATRSLTSTQDKLDRLAGGFTRFGAGAVAAAGAAAVGLYNLGNAASDLNEQTSRSRVIFGAAADSVEEFGRSAATSAGMSNRAALEAAGSFGTLFRGIGQTEQQAAQSSITFAKLAGDLASFSNTSPEEAVTALGAALRGESEPIRQYGVLLDDATLKQRALSLGLIETTTGTLPPAIRAQAAYAEILAQTSLAQGDYARTSDSAANQQRTLAAEFENLKASIGQGVLPVMTTLLGAANDLAGAFNDLSPETRETIGQFAAIGTAAVGAIGGMSLLAGQLIKLRDRFTQVTTTADGSSRTLNKLGIATGAVTGALVVGTTAYSEYNRRKQASQAITEKFTQALRDEADGQQNAVRAAIASQLTVGDLAQEYEKLGVSLSDQVRVINGESVPSFERLGSVQERLPLERLRDRMREANEDFREGERVNKALGVSTDTLGASVRASALEILNQVRNTHSLTEENTELKKILDESTKAIEDQRRAVLAGINSQLGYEDAVDNTQDAIAQMNERLAVHSEAIQRSGESSDEARAAAEEYDDAIRSAARTVLSQAAAAAEMQGATDNSTESLRIQRDELLKVADTLDAGSPLRRRLLEYATDLSMLPETKATEIQALIDQGKLNEAEDKLNEVARERSAVIRPRVDAGARGLLDNPDAIPRAGGGQVSPGQLYRFGEFNLPEIYEQDGRMFMIPGEQGRITPLSGTGSAPAPGGVQIGQVVLGHGGPRELAQELGWLMRTRGR